MIELNNEMIRVFQAGQPYQPSCRGLALEPEDGSVEHSVTNLERLSQPILAIIGCQGRVLVVFKSGEVYYASGFAIGDDSPAVAALAKFLVDHTDGDWTTQYDEMFETLKQWTVDGPVFLPPPDEADFDRERQWKPPT